MDRIAFVFAGQGAQYPGMGQELAQKSTAAAAVFQAVEAIRPGTRQQCFQGGKEELAVTSNTQPCLFTVDYACALAATEAGIRPDCAAGFSLGEVAAAAFCGLLSLEEAFRFVCVRGQWMQQCAADHPSGMAAVVRLTPAEVEDLCGAFDQLFPVNYNSPQQTVVAGDKDQLAAFGKLVKEKGGRALPLAVSGGFHSPFMAAAARQLSQYLATISFAPPSLPLYANVTAQIYGDDPASLLARQVEQPVLWTETIQNMAADGCRVFIEVGPGKTLSGLIPKIDPALTTYHVEDAASLAATVTALKEAGLC